MPPSVPSDGIPLKRFPSLNRFLKTESDADVRRQTSVPEVSEPTFENGRGPQLPVTSTGNAFKQVARTNNASKRVWDRKNACYFCERMVQKLARHLERRHRCELEVQRILAMEKGSKKRHSAFQEMKNKGNFVHNMKVRSGSKEGELMPWRRKAVGSQTKDSDDFLFCEDCHAFFFRKTLWHHKRRCSKKRGKSSSGRVQTRARNLIPPSQGMSEGLQRILDSMVIDEASLLCKSDPLILKFGEKLYMKLGHERHQKHYISTKMRELGRLLIQVRKRCSASVLTDCISPDKFPEVAAAVRELAAYDSAGNTYGVPSLALKVGQSLVKCALILKAERIQKGEDTTRVCRFLDLYDLEWTDQVARGALTTLKEKRWNKPPLIPLTRDVQKLQQYLDTELASRKARLQDEASPVTHKAFAEVVLSRLMLFNRRRQGEAGRMTIEDFSKRRAPKADDDVVDCLSPLEKQLAASLTRVVIKGKKGRGVPVLLTDDLQSGISLLIEKRSSVGVEDDNPYIFVNSASAELAALRGSDCLRKCAADCGASAPEAITSTGLRRHIATLSQVLNLRDNELDMLAGFLGHDIHVHREFYRLPEATMQVAKISKLLMCMEQGVTKMKGKTLDQLDVTMECDGEGDRGKTV